MNKTHYYEKIILKTKLTLNSKQTLYFSVYKMQPKCNAFLKE